MSDWNSDQYLKFADERTQPAVDLVNRITVDAPRRILDVGCGPGNSTGVLARRFPNAYILGIDNSANMIDKAKHDCPNLNFMLCDVGSELDKLDKHFDIVFSNACIQWIPDHRQLIGNMMGLLADGGVLAVQMPYNLDEPVHKAIRNVSSSRKWAEKFTLPRVFHQLKQDEYYDLLSDISTGFFIWQTTYFHTMKSHDDIVEWYRGTGLRPYLSTLSEDDRAAFERDFYTQIFEAYPARKNGGIIFRFPRLFFTATPL